MHPLAVINIVGLTPAHLRAEVMPRLTEFAKEHGRRTLTPVLPAVTCSVQASMLTGASPREHGIVGNGWYHRDTAEIRFWLRSHNLFQHDTVWDELKARDPKATTFNAHWRFAAHASSDFNLIERPMYKADGRKKPDCYTEPAHLRDRLQAELGVFPLFRFWGPATSIESSQWIAEAAKRVVQWHDPMLSLVYLPHLDYALQMFGPDDAANIAPRLREIDDVAGDLINFYRAHGREVIVLSEYGIEPATQPVHLNRVFRAAGWIEVREEEGGELLEPGACRAFAVADHQVAHVYVRDADDLDAVRRTCEETPGVEQVLDRAEQRAADLDHDRAGDLICIAKPGAWFTYYYWLTDTHAPDFARTVEIHRKPGYDPAELFIDPAIRSPKLALAWRLLKKSLGFRTLMDVIPLDATLVRGTHGRVDNPPEHRPVIMTSFDAPVLRDRETIPCTDVHSLIVDHITS